MTRVAVACLSVVAIALVIWAWRGVPLPQPDAPLPPSLVVTEPRLGGFAPIPWQEAPPADARVQLGQRLFHEPMLSRDNSMSCATCHRMDKGGADGLPFSPGVGGGLGVINTPTVFNAGLNIAQFWDGRVATLQAQVESPIHNPIEMGSNWAEVIGKLSQDASYRAAFAGAYPSQGITAATIADALAQFQHSLLTPNAAFDRHLRGDASALGRDELQGFERFQAMGCASCHQGVNLGGNLFQRFGVFGDYFADRGSPITPADLGRYNVTGDAADRHVFKVPALRNVALTAPYFHDAGAETLEEAVRIMGRYQLGRELGGEDVRLIVAFLRSLTGQQPGQQISQPHSQQTGQQPSQQMGSGAPQ